MIVTLKNDEKVVIQFRPQQLDTEPFEVARRALGSVVPEIKLLPDQELLDQEIWAYWMTNIPGETWDTGTRGKGPGSVVTINRSLGRILAKGYFEGSSDSVIHHRIRPHLELLLSSEDDNIRNFHEVARKLFNELDILKTLPLFVSHFDLNSVNIMVDDKCEITGLIDWELSKPLPFGMGFSRIHTLAGEYSEKKFRIPPEFNDAEEGFWEEIRQGVPEDVQSLFRTNLAAIQLAVTVGTLLNAFQLDGEEIGPYNPVVIEALPKLLTYRIPFGRGSNTPYQDKEKRARFVFGL